MANKETVIVDEDMMRGIIAKEVPVSQAANPISFAPAVSPPSKPPTENAVETEPEVVAPIVGKKIYQKRRKREEPEGYAGKFLIDDRGKNRVTVCISRELHERIRKFLPMVAPGISITTYLNNIVADHIEQYWDEITELYNAELEKPL